MRYLAQEIISRRDLLWQLVLRDLKVRYSRPALGLLWAFLTPFLMASTFYFIFSLLIQVRIPEAPFFLYLMTALFSWSFFQDSLATSATSLLDSRHLIKEANVPHYFIPLSITLANGINFLPALVIILIFCLAMLHGFPILILLLPFVIALHLFIAAGLSLIVSLLYIKWRDTKYILNIFLLLLLYLTPAFYSLQQVQQMMPRWLFQVYLCNPFVGILNLYRFVILKGFYQAVQRQIGFVDTVVFPAVFGILVVLLAVEFYKKEKSKINDHLAY